VIALTILSVLALSAPSSATAVSSEIEISTLSPDAIPPAPSAASRNGVTLIAWLDATHLLANGTDVVAVRVSTDGRVLDTTPIVIARDAAGRNQGEPTVAAANGTFFVFYTDYPGNGIELHAKRVRAADGAVLDAQPIVVARGVSSDYMPSAASDGASVLVAWSDESAGTATDVKFARFGLDGSLLEAAGAVTGQAGDQTQPAVASDGRGYVVAWTDYSAGPQILAARIREGRVVDTGIAIASPATSPAIASNGDGYAVAWVDRSGTSQDIRAARLDGETATPLDAGLVVNAALGDQSHPHVAAAAGDYAVLWFDGVTTGFAERGASLGSADGAVGASFTLQDPVENGLVATSGGAEGVLVAYPHDALRARLISSGTSATPGSTGIRLPLRSFGRFFRFSR